LVGLVNVYQAYQEHKNKKKSPQEIGSLANSNMMKNDQPMIMIHKPRNVDYQSNRADFISPPVQINNFQHQQLQQHSIETQGNNSPILKSYGSPPQRPLDYQGGHGDFSGYIQNNTQRTRKISEAQTMDNSFTLNGSQLPLNNNEEWNNNGNHQEANILPIGGFQNQNVHAHIIGKILSFFIWNNFFIVARNGNARGIYTREARMLRRNMNPSRR